MSELWLVQLAVKFFILLMTMKCFCFTDDGYYNVVTQAVHWTSTGTFLSTLSARYPCPSSVVSSISGAWR